MKYNYYQLYGLSIKTTEEIEQLIPIEASDTTDLFLEIQEQQTEKEFPFEKEATKLYSSYGFAPNQIPYLTVWKQHDSEEAFLVIRYTNGQETAFFLIPKNAKQVKVLHHPLILVSDLITYFLGPVIGCVLKLKQKVCLHSSVVNIHGKAVAFIGAKTAGKSTLIATFAALGYPIVSDDIAVLFEKEAQHFVHLGYPRMRLWKNSIDPLPSIEIKNLKPVLSHLNKYYVPLSLEKKDSWNFQSHPIPLSKIFYLQPRNDENILSIENCTSTESFIRLKQNVYAEYLIESDLNIKEFKIFGDFVNNNMVKYLNRPDDLNQLNATIHLVVNEIINT